MKKLSIVAALALSTFLTSFTNNANAVTADPKTEAVSAKGGPKRDLGNADFAKGGPKRDLGNADFAKGGPKRDLGNADFAKGGPKRDLGNADFAA